MRDAWTTNTSVKLLPPIAGTSTLLFTLLPNTALAHVSEQGFVLLLPTNIYIGSGVLAVLLTIILLAFLPECVTRKLFNTISSKEDQSYEDLNSSELPTPTSFKPINNLPSLVSTGCLFGLLFIGISGSHDPLENLLPLFIWTLWWIGFVIVHGIFGNAWQYLNPWTGVYRLTQHIIQPPLRRQLPAWLGAWPGVLGLVVFMLFALADVAPDSPSRLSGIVALYWLINLLAIYLFGEQWLAQGECFSMLFKRYALLAPIASLNGRVRIGIPGWHAYAMRATTLGGAIFILVLLGSGSFDGLNETFSWLAFIGVNPLEFPGRSAVVKETIAGLLATNVLLIAVYAGCVLVGTTLANKHNGAGKTVKYHTAFCQLSIALLPIAFAYHFAHFLTAFMINVQYALTALSDPLDTGTDLLGLGTFYVTTGFMNSHDSVEAIWLTQAAAVILGHVLSVVLAHAIALDLFGGARRAIISQIPLAAFMVWYTFIGLWLLATPRGA